MKMPSRGRSTETAQADDPLLKSKLRFSWHDVQLELHAPHSVFSSTWIDRGTLLLLENLPPGEPRAFLDLGCGYGAPGLPIAARFPRSRGLLVDRDLLAVEYCRQNARAHAIANVEVIGSLGYRDIPPVWGPFDWIVVNFPARAGEKVMDLFLEGGLRRLAPGGEMRIVVIGPLAPVVKKVAEARGLAGRKIAETGQHTVFAFGPSPETPAGGQGQDPYLRDVIDLSLPGGTLPLRLARPTDLADEPHRLRDAVPLLAECLPEVLPGAGRVLVFRSGYGLVPALALARYPGANVIATDRDLLGTELTRRNAAWAGERLRVVESAFVAGVREHGPFDLILGELSPPLGSRATLVELEEARGMLAPGGVALVLGLAKQWRELLAGAAERLGIAKRGARGAAALYAIDPKGLTASSG